MELRGFLPDEERQVLVSMLVWAVSKGELCSLFSPPTGSPKVKSPHHISHLDRITGKAIQFSLVLIQTAWMKEPFQAKAFFPEISLPRDLLLLGCSFSKGDVLDPAGNRTCGLGPTLSCSLPPARCLARHDGPKKDLKKKARHE